MVLKSILDKNITMHATMKLSEYYKLHKAKNFKPISMINIADYTVFNDRNSHRFIKN